MRESQTISILIVGLITTVMVILQLFSREANDISNLAGTTQAVLEVKQLDVKLNEEALRAASFKLVHFDGMVNTVNALNEASKGLVSRISALEEQTPTESLKSVEKINEAITRRIALIEDLKAKVALARNSGNFLLAAMRANTDDEHANLAVSMLRSVAELQGYQIFPTKQRYEETRKMIMSLRDKNNLVGGDRYLANILRHMEMSFASTQDIARILDEMLGNAAQGLLDSLLSTLQEIQLQQQNDTNGIRYVLLGMALVFFAALTFALARWNTARRRSQRVSQLFKDAVESMTEGFAFFSPENKLVFCNSTFRKMHDFCGDIHAGMTLQEFEQKLSETHFIQSSDPQSDGSTLDFTADGQWLLTSSTPMQTGGEALIKVDLTEQKTAQNQLHLAATVFQSASEAMMVTDANGVIQMVNPAFSAITGYGEEEVMGDTPAILSSGRHDKHYYSEMYRQLEQSGMWQGEIWNRRKNGEIYPEWLSITTIYDQDGKVLRRVSLFTDITSRKKSEERIHYQANYDSLTDLPNRNLFRDRLTQSINMAKRQDQRVAIFFLDLDNFKHINDTLGHLLGDELLRHVADRLRALFRTTDTIARLSGDEFIIIVNDAKRDTDLEMLLDRVLDTLSQPYDLNGNTTYTSVSIGATFYPDDGKSVDSLLQNADAAMFKAKEIGRNTYCFFTPEMNSRAQERHELEIAMHGALADGHFVLHYQPIVDPISQTVISTESLVRWNDPEKGLIPPGKFIPVAEETGLIVPLGEWILRQACKDAAHWFHEKNLNIGVSVNLSSRQFQRSNMVALVKEVLEETKLPPGKLNLEITESLLVDDESEVLQTLRELRDLGVLLSIDDFGTGYSSLSYLKRFPITTLKIDRSFIIEVLSNAEDAALTQAILSMADSLRLKVVAEGVESAGQAAFLLERQCDLIQGYYYSRPLPLEELMAGFENETLFV